MASNIIAIIFDFDDTLTPDSTTRLLQEHGINTENFWLEEVQSIITKGWDPTHAYLRLILDKIGDDKPLGNLTNESLRKFGSKLNFYPGVIRLFTDLKRRVQRFKCEIEFYVITGGLQEIVEGSKIRGYLSGVYGCQLEGENPDSDLKYVKRCITFTEKTRYLFEINKGLKPGNAAKKPYLVNEHVLPENRRIPFENMIYIGDGSTDIPCFSLIKNMSDDKGHCFGIFHPEDEKSSRKALLDLLKPDRVVSAHAPRYGTKDDLGALLRTAVVHMCTRISMASEEAGSS